MIVSGINITVYEVIDLISRYSLNTEWESTVAKRQLEIELRYYNRV